MMDYKNRELLENTYRRARLIAMALLGSLFVDIVVVEMMRWFNPLSSSPSSARPSVCSKSLIAPLSRLSSVSSACRRPIAATTSSADSPPKLLIAPRTVYASRSNLSAIFFKRSFNAFKRA